MNEGPGEVTVSEREDELMERAVRGDHDAYQSLVEGHQSRMFLLIYRQVGDRGIAEELTQDVFVRAFRALPRFEFRATFLTWITRIALNRTNSYFTSRRYKEKRQSIELNPELHQAGQRGEETDRYDDAALDQLTALIGRLSPVHRDVLVLCDIEGTSYEEAAKILGVPIGTIRSRLNRARHNLKDQYFSIRR